MSFLPSVARAQYRGNYRIHLVFNDGSEATLDFRRWLKGPVFEPLKDLDQFRHFFLDGGTVTWPNGADIAPETLYAATRGRPLPKRRLQPAKARPSARSKSARAAARRLAALGGSDPRASSGPRRRSKPRRTR